MKTYRLSTTQVGETLTEFTSPDLLGFSTLARDGEDAKPLIEDAMNSLLMARGLSERVSFVGMASVTTKPTHG